MSGVSLSADSSAKLLDVDGVAEFLGCSTRHVYRLADSGKMPPPVKLGRLARWQQAQIEAWIIDGCRPVRMAGCVEVPQ